MSQFQLTGPQLLGYLQRAFEGHSRAIRSTVALLIVFVFSEVVESEHFFQCPPNSYKYYASCFFAIPALFLCMATIFLHSGFWKIVRGCCYYERFCEGPCCCYWGWCINKAFLEIIFQSLLSGFKWIFWALLQRKYYICYTLGGTKEAKLKNATTDEKRLQIEYDYTNAGKASQTTALLLLCGVLVVAFLFLSVVRCLCQQEIGLPSDDEVERLESEAAVKAFRENVEQLARQQGKKYADVYFPVAAFEERGQQVQQESEQKQSNLKEFLSAAREQMEGRYPRTTGDMSQPCVSYEKKETNSRGRANEAVDSENTPGGSGGTDSREQELQSPSANTS